MEQTNEHSTAAPADPAASIIAPPAEVPTEQVEEIDPAVLEMLQADVTAPTNLGEYVFEYEGVELTPEQQAEDREFRVWLADISCPPSVGTAIAAEVNAAAVRTADWTPEQHELDARSAMAELERLWGPRTDAMVGLARSLVQELDAMHGGRITELLESTGAGNSVGLVVQLAQHAERREAARKARVGK